MRITVNAILNGKNCNTRPPLRSMDACVRYMRQEKKVNKRDEVQHKVNRSSQKYPTVPQLGFLFYQIPLTCSKNCMHCIYEHSCRGTFSHLTHRGHSGLKVKKTAETIKQHSKQRGFMKQFVI